LARAAFGVLRIALQQAFIDLALDGGAEGHPSRNTVQVLQSFCTMRLASVLMGE
jgi:hypothetical protein